MQLFRCGRDGLFTLHGLTGEAEVRLESIDCVVLAADVFEGVDPPAA